MEREHPSEVQPVSLEREYEKLGAQGRRQGDQRGAQQGVRQGDSVTPSDVATLREWLDQQPHLPHQHITDLDLLLAYWSCSCSTEVTKQVLDLHYTLRTLFTNFFHNRKVDAAVEQAVRTVLVSALGGRADGRADEVRAVYCRLLDPDPRSFVFDDVIRTFMMMFDLWQLEEGAWPGFIIVIDMERATLAHLARVHVSSVKQVLYFLQEAMFVRLKGVHFLNAPFFMDKVMMLLKPFMKKELQEMVHIHEVDADTIYQFVPKDSFPMEKGGKHKDYSTLRDELLARLRSNKRWLRCEGSRRVSEQLRSAPAHRLADQLDLTGSFKKLDID